MKYCTPFRPVAFYAGYDIAVEFVFEKAGLSVVKERRPLAGVVCRARCPGTQNMANWVRVQVEVGAGAGSGLGSGLEGPEQ